MAKIIELLRRLVERFTYRGRPWTSAEVVAHEAHLQYWERWNYYLGNPGEWSGVLTDADFALACQALGEAAVMQYAAEARHGLQYLEEVALARPGTVLVLETLGLARPDPTAESGGIPEAGMLLEYLDRTVAKTGGPRQKYVLTERGLVFSLRLRRRYYDSQGAITK